MIRHIRAADIDVVTSIYNHYILHSIVTFEEEIISGEVMSNRVKLVSENFPWLIYESNGGIKGYAYASWWNKRSAYKFTAESTVYLKAGVERQGIGTQLYDELINRLLLQGIRVIIGGISLPNPASVALHEKMGFEKVAHFKEAGFKFGKWIDVGYWQLTQPGFSVQ